MTNHKITATIDIHDKHLVSRKSHDQSRSGVILKQEGGILLLDLLVSVNGAVTLTAQSADALGDKKLFDGVVLAGRASDLNDDAGIARLMVRSTPEPITGYEVAEHYQAGFRVGFEHIKAGISPDRTFRVVARSPEFEAGYRAGAAEYYRQFIGQVDRAIEGLH